MRFSPTSWIRTGAIPYVSSFFIATSLTHASEQEVGRAALPGDSWNVEPLGRWAEGPCYSAAIRGDTVYFGNGAYFEVVDFSYPGTPVHLGRALLPSPIETIDLTGDYAYTGLRKGGIRIIDISDPTSPVSIGAYDIEAAVYGVKVSGDFTYAASPERGLVVIDITDPSVPSEISVHQSTWIIFYDVEVAGSYAYLSGGNAGHLEIVDVSDPADPIHVKTYLVAGSAGTPAYSICTGGSYAYLSVGNYLVAVDVSDPYHPFEVGRTSNGPSYDLEISGSFIYAASWMSGVKIFDISNPALPEEVGSYDTPGETYDVALGGTNVCAADRSSGVRLIDASSPEVPVEVGAYDTGTEAIDVAFSGGIAYVAVGGEGIAIVDGSDPAAPVKIGLWDTADYALSLEISGDYLYVADRQDGLRILDVSDPGSTFEVGYYDTTGSVYDLCLDGTTAYLAFGTTGLVIVDVRDPANPARLASFYTSGPVRSVTAEGGYAYLADGENGLFILDVSDPHAPQLEGTWDGGVSANKVDVSGTTAYLAADFDGLRIIDATDPASPLEVGFLPNHYCTDVAVYGDYAYLVTGFIEGLLVIDVSDSTSPVEAGYYETGDQARAVRAAADRVYVADGEDGFYVLRNSLIPPSPVLIEFFEADAGGGGVEIRWSIASEENLLGFNLYRSTRSFTAFSRINAVLLPPNARYYHDGEIEPGKSYAYRLGVVDGEGKETYSPIVSVKTKALATILYQNYPNPFNTNTAIRFLLDEGGHVVLSVFDLQGRLVKNLLDRELAGGLEEVYWDGRDAEGNFVGSGVYFCRLRMGKKALARKMVLLK